MKPRLKIAIIADGDPGPGHATLATDPNAPAPVITPGGRFHALLIVEGVQTGDKRLFVEGSITWVEPGGDALVPLMADDENHSYHEQSMLVGNFDTFERRGTEIHGWGAYIADPDEEAAKLIALIEAGDMRGISVDVDAYEFEILFPLTDADGNPLDPIADPLADPNEPATVPPDNEENIDGVQYEVVPIMQPIERVTQGRIRGATALTFPAFVEAFIEPDTSGAPALAASAAPVLQHHHLTGVMLEPLIDGGGTGGGTGGKTPIVADGSQFKFPDVPPREWFYVEEPAEPMALTILDNGQIMGHLAEWGACHIGITGECVDPPPSPSNYARFHLGETPVADGGRVSVGKLTFHTGHADRTWNPRQTLAHYDDTGTAAARIRAIDGEHGVWVCGAMRPGLSLAQITEIMENPPSGDWRVFGGEYDMVAALAVPVPGFQNTNGRVYVAREPELGMVASMIFVNPVGTTRYVGPQSVDADVAHRIGNLIAASIGRSRKDRVAALSARVHGGHV